MTNKVIWSEGVFLQPQHFQQQECYLENMINQKTMLSHPYNWGIETLTINSDLLSLGKLALTSASGIFPDGTVFNAPSIDALPTQLPIPLSSKDCIVYLGIPLKNASQANVTLSHQPTGHRYHSTTTTLDNYVAESKQSADIQLGKLSLKLLLEGDDTEQYCCIAIAKIKEVRSSECVALYDDIMTPVLSINRCAKLKQFTQEIHSLLKHRADSLAYRLTDTKQSAGSDISDILLLQISNRYEPLFWHLSHADGIHPITLYSHCIELLGEINTFTKDNRRPDNMQAFQHHQPNRTFDTLMRDLRKALNIVLEQNSEAIDLISNEYGIWTADISETLLEKDTTFILAIYADSGSESIRAHLPNQIKITDINSLEHLVSRALPGVSIEPLAVAPRQIPYHSNFTYFVLSDQSDHWNHIKQQSNIAIHIGGHFTGLKIELWAIKG